MAVPTLVRVLALCAVASLAIVSAPRAARAGAEAQAAAPAAPWNVVLITVDALRADRMSLYGNPRPTTPRLDAFARDAAVFDSFFAVSAHTSPGVVSLLTGQSPAVHAQTTQYSFYDPEIPSPLRTLAARGYDVVGYAVRGATYADLGFTRGQDGKPTEVLLAELAQSAKPFFAWLHARETHLPYRPAPAQAGTFTRGMKRDSPLLRAVREFTFVLRHPPDGFAYRHAGDVAARAEDAEPLRALYDECVSSADARVGAWLAQLRESGLLERTIVVITADHGEELLEHGWVGHASTGYDGKLTDEILRIPLLVRVPGAKHAGRYGALASQVDVMPTVFALLGIDGSALAPNQQGVSLAPVLRGEAREVREAVFAETTRKGWTTPREETGTRVVAIRTRDLKVVAHPWEGASPAREEWIDLAANPAEREGADADAEPPEALRHRVGIFWAAEREREEAAAGRIVREAADAHLAALEAAIGRGDAAAAVGRWQALRRLHTTWTLEGRAVVRSEAWSALQVRAADRAASAIRCEGRALSLAGPECQKLR